MSTFTTEQLNALTEAIAQGARTVKYQDKEVTYRSLKDMLELKQLMEEDLGIKSKNSRIKATFDKGLC